jgi:5-hydroxyisourate hydrolase-like protein (transthyretin family)
VATPKDITKPYFKVLKITTMKRLNFLIFTLLIISLLSSCDKEEPIPPTIVNGQVLEQGSNKPLEGVKVVLMEGTYNGTGSGTYSYRPIDTVLTDKDGKYTYSSLTKGDLKDYVLWFYKDQYYIIDNSPEQVSIKWNKTSEVITKMFSFAWITIRVTNSIPFDENDKVEVGGEWTTGQYNRFQGKDVNATFTQKIRGGIKTEVVWWVIKNDIIKPYIDSVYIKPLDTTYYQIKY